MVLKNKNPQNRPVDLPNFDNPPVIEVLLSVQFAELEKFKTVQAGLLWNSVFKNKYHQISEHPRIESSFEVIGKNLTQKTNLEIAIRNTPEVPRLWFISSENKELVQIQPDRFIHNWRKIGEGENYPRYEQIRKKFFSELRLIRKFSKEENLGKIQPNQCEITYVNHIDTIGKESKFWDSLHEVFNFWKKTSKSPIMENGTILNSIEDTIIKFRQPIISETGDFLGRLFISIEPAITPDKKKILRFVLTVKGPSEKKTLIGLGEFFDLGREIIVRNFTHLTTDKMHKIWKRTK